MTDAAELLDRALDSGDARVSDEMRDLVGIAAELAGSLAAWRLSAVERAQLYARTLELVGRSPLQRLRRLRSSWRAPALVGGGLVTLGALTAIGIAVARGRRHGQAAQPA